MTDYSGVFDNDTGQRLGDFPTTDGLPERLRLWSSLDKIEAGPVLAYDLQKAADQIVQLQADRDRWKLTAETIADNNYPTPTNAAINTYIDLGEQANL